MNSKQTVKMNTAYASSAKSFRGFLNCWIFESHNPRTKSDSSDRLHYNVSCNLSSREWTAEYIPKNNFNVQGNRTRIVIDYGDCHIQIKENAYVIDNAAVWYLERLSLATVRSAAPNKRAQDKTAVRTSEFTDNSNGLFLSETIQPDNALAVLTTYKRDPKRQVTLIWINLGNDPYLLSKTYSVLDATGRFYIKIINAFRYTNTLVYDSTRGCWLSPVGPNSRTTHFTYDALERVIREDRSDGICATTEDAYDDSQSVTIPRNNHCATSKYRVTIINSVAPPSTTGYPRISHAIRVSIVGFHDRMLHQDMEDGAFDQGDCTAENCHTEIISARWIKTTFNLLGHVDAVTEQDSTRAKTIYNGRKTTNEFDAADQTLNRVCLPQSAGGVTRFDYRCKFDSIGNITRCTNELANFTKNITYARLNRLTDATTVGASTVAASYDDLGTIINHTSSSGLSDSGAYGYVNGTNRPSNARARIDMQPVGITSADPENSISPRFDLFRNSPLHEKNQKNFKKTVLHGFRFF